MISLNAMMTKVGDPVELGKARELRDRFASEAQELGARFTTMQK